jgi:hypothetical protein
MIEMRDGEVAVWFRCCQRRDPVPSLALALASGHRCGSGGNPATSGRVGPPLPSREVVYRPDCAKTTMLGPGSFVWTPRKS